MIVRSLVLLVVLLSHTGCPAPKTVVHAKPQRGDAPTLRAVEDLPTDLMWQQRVTVTWKSGSRQFDAALQKQHSSLLLVGLGPTGRPGFVITYHDDKGVTLENRTGRDIPFSPAYIIADVQRSFYPWLLAGQKAAMVHGVFVTEVRENGKLRKRLFRASASAPIDVIVTFDKWTDKIAPGHVVVENLRHNYTLEIETLSEELI